MIETCQRCGKQSAKLEKCDYCSRKICFACVKSSKRKKIGHFFICKDCWNNMKKRKTYEGATKG